VRRTGYIIAIGINAAMLVAVNAWPGWQEVPFLTQDTTRVVVLVNLTLVVNIIVNLIYLIQDPAWLRALGELTTAAVGLISTIWLLRVFPFDFTGYEFNWAVLVRVVLIVGVVGTAIAIVVQLITLVRLALLSTKD
jgi:hypothetical protein